MFDTIPNLMAYDTAKMGWFYKVLKGWILDDYKRPMYGQNIPLKVYCIMEALFK